MWHRVLNIWNVVRYTVYLPIYDGVAARFEPFRKLSISRMRTHSNQKVLLVGAGTGLDFKHFPKDVELVSTDITPMMVNYQRIRARHLGMNIECRVEDAHDFSFPDKSFDAVVLHLIFAVVPNPELCMQEAARVLKPGGQILVFDKFHSGQRPPNLMKKALGFITNVLFSNINRTVDELVRYSRCELVFETDVWLKGIFRVIELKKPTR